VHWSISADVALAPNKNEVQIHQFAAGKWQQLDTLSEHGQRVTGIDWAPTSNRIVTCGAVSIAYLSAGKWFDWSLTCQPILKLCCHRADLGELWKVVKMVWKCTKEPIAILAWSPVQGGKGKDMYTWYSTSSWTPPQKCSGMSNRYNYS